MMKFTFSTLNILIFVILFCTFSFAQNNQNLAIQIALFNKGFSCGAIDNKLGTQTRQALKAFQKLNNIKQTGDFDTATTKLLKLPKNVLIQYQIAESDLKNLTKIPKTWLEKSQAESLNYENIVELLGEKFLTNVAYLRQINPKVDWKKVLVGSKVLVPNVERKYLTEKADFIEVSLSQKTMQVFSSDKKLLAHFPCSIAADKTKRKKGEMKVVSVAENPTYTFTPENFPESIEAQELKRNLILPAGANNPVGLGWIGLDLPSYGIHGTPIPEDVGKTESHGCFRLANWDVKFLLKTVKIGMKVVVKD
jgi:lipoprotein-anchoring transpeptidase ErfK/SrfK